MDLPTLKSIYVRQTMPAGGSPSEMSDLLKRLLGAVEGVKDAVRAQPRQTVS
jgi:hypothetical protein